MPESDVWEPARVAVGYPTEHLCRLAEGADPGEQFGDSDGQHAEDHGRHPAGGDCRSCKGGGEVCLYRDVDRGAGRQSTGIAWSAARSDEGQPQCSSRR